MRKISINTEGFWLKLVAFVRILGRTFILAAIANFNQFNSMGKPGKEKWEINEGGKRG